MQNKTEEKNKTSNGILYYFGLVLLICGIGILLFFGARHAYRMIKLELMIRDNAVLEIPELKVRVPVLEGTSQEVLAAAAGHFDGTGDFGKGNYCIAGHSSPYYKYPFNALSDAEEGMKIILSDKEKNEWVYAVSEIMTVEPNEVWILDDFDDDRITLVTCTDDGSERIVVTGKITD